MSKKSSDKKAPFPWISISVLVFIAILLMVIISVYTSGEKNRLRQNTGNELEAIVSLKIEQIEQWRLEKLNDAKLIYDNWTLVEQIEAFFIKTDNNNERIRLSQFLNSLIENYDFGSAILLNAGGTPGLAVPSTQMVVDEGLKANLRETIVKPRITLTDLHDATLVGYSHFDLIIPMMMPQEGDTVLSGFLVLRIDPAKELNRITTTWPTPSVTSECFLFRTENDSVIFLNNSSRNKGDLSLQKYAGDIELAAINGYNKGESYIRSFDHKGNEVIVVARPVSGTGWYLEAKTDTSEILFRFKQEVILLWGIMAFVILALAIIGYLIIRSSRNRFFRNIYHEELNRKALMKHFDFVMSHGNDIIILFDEKLNIVEANDRAMDAYGYPRTRFIGMNASDLRSEDSAIYLADHIKDLDKSGSSFLEVIHKRFDGSTFPVEISARTVDVEGVRYYQSIGRDITERKKTEEDIKENSKKLNTIINNLRGVVFLCLDDEEWTMKYISDGIYELSGYLPGDFFENKIRSYSSIIDPEDQENVKEEIHKSLSTGYLYSIEYRIITSAGNKRWVWERGRGVYEDNKLVALEGFISDITDRKRIENELIRARDKAEQSDKLKTAFLHNISHEIRTPMNAIIGFTTLLDTPDLDDESRRQYLDIIYQSSNQLLSIITDIVDISNIETGLVKVFSAEVHINSIIRNLYEQYRLRAKRQNLAFFYSTDMDDDEAVVMTDETKLIQVMSNLLNNALKFTHNGKIEFGYISRGKTIEFFVNDTGIGIPAEQQNRVFDRFYQVEDPTSKQYSGTGLGLSISKAYSELLGGTIWLESTIDEGSRFHFSIPFTKLKTGTLVD